ncbi:MAG: hypothetical protein FJ096_06655 [Deltaproteobacteria bacterium]|nr:hypothetical protein [Deltaproteobacteria bacterium]
MIESWAFSGDLERGWLLLAAALAFGSLVMLVFEVMRRGPSAGRLLVAGSGLLAVLALVLAVLRPVRVFERSSTVGARLVVLVDASRSVDLPADAARSRRAVEDAVLEELRRHFADVRVRALAFSQGEPSLLEGKPTSAAPTLGSDLTAALESIARATDEQPQAVVVVSDGRLERPGPDVGDATIRATTGRLQVPVHTVSLATAEPRDAHIRSVRLAGSIVAHQPARLEIEIGCTGGLGCGEQLVTVRELHLGEAPVIRASSVVRVDGGRGAAALEVTLDRAGRRILEIELDSPDGDAIPENDRRFVAVDVARDRVRLLHVAGRPTYDVRALRTWLKSDASVDVVAFFILRTRTDDVVASQEELALIPFPVDELFTKHLSSFDAVVLQDFDAEPYGLSIHLRRLADYVKQGGGLIMVGGPNAFVSGNYAQTALAEVLPVSLRGIPPDAAVDLAAFSPALTRAGRRAPVLEPVASLVGERWPEMPGTNVVGDAREGATVLLEHPRRHTKTGAAMPVLALGEYGSGRTIALTVDGSHMLQFSSFAADSGGRAHGAFWDAMLGWLMRDPRFEPASVELPRGCIAGVPTTMALRAMFADEGAEADLEIQRMGSGKTVRQVHVTFADGNGRTTADLGPLEAGGYTATVRLDRQGRSAPSRHDFACEAGGDEWADPRPDPTRLESIAQATGGIAVAPDGITKLPQPRATRVVAERRVEAWLPAWMWTALAAALMGGHWVARRRDGLS